MPERRIKRKTLEGTASSRAAVAEVFVEKIMPFIDRNVDFQSDIRAETAIDSDATVISIQIVLPTISLIRSVESELDEVSQDDRQEAGKVH